MGTGAGGYCFVLLDLFWGFQAEGEEKLCDRLRKQSMQGTLTA